MTSYIALLRAVNVGGTGKLPMAELKAMCEEIGLEQVRTYIASGNVVFRSGMIETAIRAALEKRLKDYAGKPVGVLIRTAAELADVVKHNPFSDEAANRTVALFVDGPLPPTALDDLRGRRDERLALGRRAIYIFYGEGMGRSRLVVPAGKTGTARNMNTVAKLATMAAALSGC